MPALSGPTSPVPEPRRFPLAEQVLRPVAADNTAVARRPVPVLQGDALVASAPPARGERVEIQIYPSYGHPGEVELKGRVLDAHPVSIAKAEDSGLRNLVRNLSWLESDERAGVALELTIGDEHVRTQTDREGFFSVKLKPTQPLPVGVQRYQVQLSPIQNTPLQAATAYGQVMVQPKQDCTPGIISDLDDTLQETHATSKLKTAKSLFLENAHSQKAVPGMAELLTALDTGVDGQLDGDVTYLSGSPVNYFPRIQAFLDKHAFPDGAVELKNMGFRSWEDHPLKQTDYKLGHLRELFTTYPDKSFVLFGDSGQQDPEIYRQIATEFPGRVTAIYINNVTDCERDDPRYKGMQLTRSSLEAAQDLQRRGLITEADVERVRAAL
ncbi:MAG: phosphatase domain-containing protein [Candidatus Sericytochromatia bacterium]